MHQLPVIQPTGSPSCWGQKYQDGDVECGQCRFNDTCRKEVLRGAMNSPVTQVPMPQRPLIPQQPWPAPVPYPQPQVPLPTFRATPPPPPPVPPYQQQPVPVAVQPLYHPNYPHPPQQPSFYALPAAIPDPMQPWARPGANAPPYYFGQYPGETAVQRITKNLILRAIAAIAQELVGFLVQWTWPPSRGNN